MKNYSTTPREESEKERDGIERVRWKREFVGGDGVLLLLLFYIYVRSSKQPQQQQARERLQN